MREIKNAIITNVNLSNVDDGCLTAWLHLSYDGSGQAFGSHMFYPLERDDATGFFIWRVLEVLEKTDFTKLVGTPCRVDADHNTVHSLGHFLKDKWFCLRTEFETREKERDLP